MDANNNISVDNFTLTTARGPLIYATAHTPSQPRGLFICCHGFKGYKDYSFFPLLCNTIAKNGIKAIRFNFSHSGVTDDFSSFSQLELFSKDTYSKQIDDLSRVVVQHRGRMPVVIFGHSRGGITASLFCSQQPTSSTVAGLIMASSPHKAIWIDQETENLLRSQGEITVESSRTGQQLKLTSKWINEVDENPYQYDPLEAVSRLKCPVLVLHGDADDTVPRNSADELARRARTASLRVIQGANHTYRCPNPLTKDLDVPCEVESLISYAEKFTLSCMSED